MAIVNTDGHIYINVGPSTTLKPLKGHHKETIKKIQKQDSGSYKFIMIQKPWYYHET